MSSADEDEKIRQLSEWARDLATVLGLDVEVGAGHAIDVERVLDLAGSIAHAVMRPAAPLTAYIVGYAAGRAASETGSSGRGLDAVSAEALANAAASAERLAVTADWTAAVDKRPAAVDPGTAE